MNDSTGKGPFGKRSRLLDENGYHVVPALGKRVLLKDWTGYQYKPTDATKYADHNIGILTKFTPTLDVDITEPADAEAVRALLPRGAPVRYGRKGFAMPFQLGAGTAPFRKITVDLRAPGGAHDRIEFLADGQQVIVEGIHPDTGQPYRWNGAGDLGTVPLANLPVTNIQQARGLVQRIVDMLLERGYQLLEHVPAAVQKAAGEAIATARGLPPMPHVEGLPDVLWRALDVLDPTPREQWIAVGHHLKAIGAGWAHEAWLEWSRRSPAYQPGDEERWDTFQPDRSGGQHALRVMAGVPEPMAFEPEPEAQRTPDPKRKRGPLLAWLQDDTPQPKRWLIKGVLERGTVAVVWGQPASFKSFLALDWALSIAYGVPWNGNPVHTGEVVYVAGEGHSGLTRRTRAWRTARGFLDEPLDGRIAFSHRAISLTKETVVSERVGDLIEEVRAAGKHPKLWVIDTVARNMAGNENAQQDMGAMIKAATALIEAFPESTVVFVHHANKEGGKRGSTVLQGDIDADYKCERVEGTMQMTLHSTKMKDDSEMPNTQFVARVVSMGRQVDEFGEVEEVRSLVLEPSVHELTNEDVMDDRILQAVRELREQGKVASVRAIRPMIGVSQNDVLAAIRSLLDRGQLVRAGGKQDGYALPSGVTEEPGDNPWD